MDASVIGQPKFRIALRYHKNGNAAGTRWAIRTLIFNTLAY